MSSIEDKNKLLSQLKIDKDEQAESPVRPVHLLLSAIVSAAMAGGIVFFMTSNTDSATLPQTTKERSSNIEKPPANEITESNSKSAGSSSSKDKNFQFANQNEILNASGYITARRIATVSAEIMGLITSVNVEEGMLVKTDQILATLDHSIAEVNLNLAIARAEVVNTNIASITIDLEEAQRVLARLKQLDKESYSSESQITRAQADVDKLKTALASAQADIKVAQWQVKYQRELFDNHTIRAPFSGVVTVKNAQPGEIVAPSSAGGGFTRTGICTIVDMDSLEIEVDVNEAFIGRVEEGQKVKANLDAYPKWDIPASVIAIIPTAERAKATVRVRIKIEQKDHRILPDMGVKVAFLKESKSGE